MLFRVSVLFFSCLLFMIPKIVKADADSQTFMLTEDERVEFFKLHQQLIDALKSEFPNDVKPKKTQIPCKQSNTGACTLSPDVATASYGGGCISTCAFTAAWAVASCRATACAACPGGFTYCSSSEVFTYAYASAKSCMSLCKKGTIPAAACL